MMNETILSYLLPEQFQQGTIRIRGLQDIGTKNIPSTFTLSNYRTAPEGVDLHFAPNWPDLTTKKVRTAYCVWIDLDAGRTEKKEYHSLQTVAKKKKDWLRQIDAFHIPPTLVAGTRNGYHVYWAIHETTDLKRWKAITSALIDHFNADTCSKKLKQLSRLPVSTWYKSSTGLPPYDVTCVRYTPNRYDLEDFGDLDGSTVEVQESESDSPVTGSTKITTGRSSYGRGRLRRRLICDHMIETGEYGDPGDVVCCPFHDDKKPSASVLDDGGIFCHACGTAFSLFTRYSYNYCCTEIEAVRDLAIECGVDVEGCPNEALTLTAERIRFNMTVLEDYVAQVAPLYQRLFRGGKGSESSKIQDDVVYGLVSSVHDTMSKVFDIHQVVDAEGNPAISYSYRQMADATGSGKDRGGAIFRLTSLLGLLRPTPLIELPQDVHDQAHRNRVRSGFCPSCGISFVGIPDYHSEEFKAMFKARLDCLSRVNLRQSMLTYDSLIEIFDEEIAQWVWPMENGEGHERSSEYREIIYAIIERHIERRGFTDVYSVAGEFSKMSGMAPEKALRECYYQIRIISTQYPDLKPRRVRKKERQSNDTSHLVSNSIICPFGISETSH